MYSMSDVSVTIQSGGSVSSAFLLKGARDIGLHVPALTSCQVLLDVAMDVSSASFRAVTDIRSLGASFSYPVGAGPAALAVGTLLAGFRYTRLRTSVTQGADRTFILSVRA